MTSKQENRTMKTGEKVTVKECVGSKIPAGTVVTVIAGPLTVAGTANVFRVRAENGTVEEFHQSRLER
jgi:hypothetical protein